MLSSSELGQTICNDLDQNAYTTWYDSPKILKAINSACNYVRAYAKRPWNLEHWHKVETALVSSFTFDHNIFYPYRAYLDGEKKDITAVPIVDFLHEDTKKIYVKWNIVKTTEPWKVLDILYHAWYKKITSLATNDIDIPDELEQALIHVSLRFIYPGGMDLWSTLANQHFNQAKELLTTYAKAYGPSVQPKQAEPAAIYR